MHAHRQRIDHRTFPGAHLRGARWMEGGLGVARRPRRGSPHPSRPPRRVRSRRRRSRESAGWPRMSPRDVDRLDPFATVLVGREVVEPDRRMHGRVGRGQADRAARVRVHRPDVDLVAVTACRRRPVVADRERQEVEHQVRVRDVARCCARTRRPRSGSSRPGRAGGTATGSRSTAGATCCNAGCMRDRLRAAVLDVDLEVVLEVRADTGQVRHRRRSRALRAPPRRRRRRAAAAAAS